ncbi:hypothetical protein PspLS_00232 [Pyricularia sp. CBS 133598]|nr:hypothetical protein PspLS_00232 [Pyricularia sp. CBS 133598]
MQMSIATTFAAFATIHAAKISLDAKCGNGVTCQGSSYGNCCSRSGWCGVGATYCGTGCQSAFGICDVVGQSKSSQTPTSIKTTSGASPPSGTASARKITDTGGCGKDHQYMTCAGSAFGTCCSSYGYCGSLDTYCGAGCQEKFGTCRSNPVGTKAISPDARCGYSSGSTGGYTCKNSIWGNCCSDQLYCGSTDAYCGKGCQAEFGDCSHTTNPSSTSTSASSTGFFTSILFLNQPTISIPTTTSVSSSLEPTPTIKIESLTTTSKLSSSSTSTSSTTDASSTSLTSSSSTSYTSSSPELTTSNTLLTSTLTSMSSSSSTSTSSTTNAPSISTTTTSSSGTSALPSNSQVPCFKTTSNYFTNPGIEAGASVSPWTVSSSSVGWYLGTFSDPIHAHSGNRWMRVSSSQGFSKNVEVVQTNVRIPSGTTVTGSGWVNFFQGPAYPTTIVMIVDGVEVGSPYKLPEGGYYTQFGGGRLTVSGDTHVIGVRVVGSYPTAADLVDLDDLLLTIAPPDGAALCP